MSNKFVINPFSNIAHKDLDLSASLPLAPGATLYSEEIPAGVWRQRGFNVHLNTLSCQINISIETSYDKKEPRGYGPVYHALLEEALDFDIASTASEPGVVSFSEVFAGDWIRFKIVNTGANPIEDLELTAVLADSPDFS